MRVRTWASTCLLSCAALIAWSASSLVVIAGATETPGPPCTTPAQLGVVVVIDDSGSTSTTDPHDLRTDAAVIAMQQQATGGVFAMSTFSSLTHRVVAPVALSTATRASAEAAIRGRFVDGDSTDYQAAFLEAGSALAAMPSTVDKRAVIFVSDGMPNSSAFTSDRPIGAAGTPIYTVGFGGASSVQLAGIAARSGGQSFPISQVADLQPTMAKILAVLECNAQNIVQQVALAPGATKSIPFSVAPSESEFKALAAWGSGTVTVSLRRPNGTTMDATNLASGERWDNGMTYASGVGVDPQRGGWSFQLTASAANLATVDATINVWGSTPLPPIPAPIPDPQPPVVVPPAVVPPAVVPPITSPPVVIPPIVHPPIVIPPVDLPPVLAPPIIAPPVVMPPVFTPPVFTPPARHDTHDATPPLGHPAPGSCTAAGTSRGSRSQVALGWGAVDGPSTAAVYGYVVSYKPDASQGAWHIAPATGNLDAVITGNTPATSYTYAVRAQYVDGTLSEPCTAHATIPAFQEIIGKGGDDNLRGSDGQDHINGGRGDDHIDGGDGNDTIDGGFGSDHLSGGGGNDSIHGGSGRDRADGGAGDDTIDVRDGHGGDIVKCGSGRDKVIADRADRVSADCEVRTSR